MPRRLGNIRRNLGPVGAPNGGNHGRTASERHPRTVQKIHTALTDTRQPAKMRLKPHASAPMTWNGNNEDPRRRLLVKALAAGFFSSPVGIREATAQALGGRPAPLPPGKSIYRIEGQVLVNGQPATLDMQVVASSTVQTGKNSEVVYAVGE